MLPTDAGKSVICRPVNDCFASTPFMGPMSWPSWDGTEEGAAAAIDEEAYLKQDVAHDQSHGPTGWETELDR